MKTCGCLPPETFNPRTQERLKRIANAHGYETASDMIYIEYHELRRSTEWIRFKLHIYWFETVRFLKFFRIDRGRQYAKKNPKFKNPKIIKSDPLPMPSDIKVNPWQSPCKTCQRVRYHKEKCASSCGILSAWQISQQPLTRNLTYGEGVFENVIYHQPVL